jgi:hypothetical protein
MEVSYSLRSLSIVSHHRPSLNLSAFVYDNLHVLGRLTNLEKIQISFQHVEDDWPVAPHRNKEVQQKKLTRVHTLRMIPYNPNLWKMCANVISLSTTDFLS